MKITKRQLRRIIKEERNRVLVEFNAAARRRAHSVNRRQPFTEAKTPEQWADFVYDVISTELRDMGSDEIIEGSNVGDGLEIARRQFKDAARGPTR